MLEIPPVLTDCEEWALYLAEYEEPISYMEIGTGKYECDIIMWMIENIVKSANLSSALAFFVVSPVRCYSVLELAKRLRVPYLKMSHTLNRLTGEEYLKTVIKRGKKYYILNHRHKLLPEIKGHFTKNGPKYHDEMFSAILKLGDIRAAFLSGLFTGRPELPVDILLVGKINLMKLAEFMKNVEQLMGQEINYSIMSESEFKTRRDTFDKFIKDIFDYPHLVVLDKLK